MSADAKVWRDTDDERAWGAWRGIHDGDCTEPHNDIGLELSALLASIERCMGGKPMRWETRVYRDGQVGLRGFTW